MWYSTVVVSAWIVCRDASLPDWARAHGVLVLGALAIYVCQVAFHELSYTPMDNSLVFFLAGTVMGLRPAAKPAAATAAAGLSDAPLGRAATA